MKKDFNALNVRRRWLILRGIGIALSGIPVLLMLVAGIIGSIVSGQPRMDVFLPAELCFLTFPGMFLMALAAVKQRVYPRLSTALPVTAAAALVLCQGLALLSGIASGLREAKGPLMAVLIGLLLLFDLAAIAAPLAGILSIRRLRNGQLRNTTNREEDNPWKSA